MIDVESDPARKLVTITYRGAITASDAADGFRRAQLAIGSMQSGFGLLVDFTPLTSMDPACAPAIAATMDYANSHGIAAVVRVIPDPQRDIGMQILSRFHYGPKVETYTTETIAEAMRLLFD